MIDFDHFPWAVSDMIRRSVGSIEALPGGTSSPSIYLGHKWARTIQRRRKRSKRIYRMYNLFVMRKTVRDTQSF